MTHQATGVVVAGHGVASGRAADSPFAAGTIELQAPHFAALGLDLSPFVMATVNLDLAPLLPGITAETLLIWGDQDSATPLWQAQQMARLLPNAGLAVIPGAGHYSFFDNPPLFYAILDSYTRSLGVH